MNKLSCFLPAAVAILLLPGGSDSAQALINVNAARTMAQTRHDAIIAKFNELQKLISFQINFTPRSGSRSPSPAPSSFVREHCAYLREQFPQLVQGFESALSLYTR